MKEDSPSTPVSSTGFSKCLIALWALSGAWGWQAANFRGDLRHGLSHFSSSKKRCSSIVKVWEGREAKVEMRKEELESRKEGRRGIRESHHSHTPSPPSAPPPTKTHRMRTLREHREKKVERFKKTRFVNPPSPLLSSFLGSSLPPSAPLRTGETHRKRNAESTEKRK